jgi:hypothetical protein
MTREEGTYLFASLEDVLDGLDSIVDVVGNSITSALGRHREGVVGALAVTTRGLRKLCHIVSMMKHVKKKRQALTTVDSNPVSTVLLRQLGSVGGDLDLEESDVAVLEILHVLLGVEGAEAGALGVAAFEMAQTVDAVLLHLGDAHAGDAVVGFVHSSDDVAESGTL